MPNGRPSDTNPFPAEPVSFDKPGTGQAATVEQAGGAKVVSGAPAIGGAEPQSSTGLPGSDNAAGNVGS